MTNEIIEFYREHLKPIIQKMLLKTNYQGQGEVDYEEFGRDFDELLDLAIIGMQSNSDEDCISRKDAINAIKRTVATEQIKELKRLPSVQPKPKTGHWIEHPHEAGINWEFSRYECSECHAWAGYDSDYCPNCGAKMVEPQESEG